jgi:hypothetical protein
MVPLMARPACVFAFGRHSMAKRQQYVFHERLRMRRKGANIGKSTAWISSRIGDSISIFFRIIWEKGHYLPTISTITVHKPQKI